MAYSDVTNAPANFSAKLYTGNGSTQSITGVGFKPDWVWIKERASAAHDHFLYDSTRGATYKLTTNNNNAQSVVSGLTSFDTDGFSLGSSDGTNENSVTFVAWNWKANGGSTTSNGNGSITSNVQVNSTAGFSIVTYTGTGSNATVGHGLSTAPKFVQVKDYSGTQQWTQFFTPLNNNNYAMQWDTTGGYDSASTYWNATAPTATTFSIGTNSRANNSAANYVAYCFEEKTGFSKMTTYQGNGNADGPFIYCGFKPAYCYIKAYAGTTGGWDVFDNKRDPVNVVDQILQINSANSEATSDDIDFLSNGIKIRNTSGNHNGNGNNYLVMAFAEAPFVADVDGGLPTTAR
jgi:hypothetical protein